MLNSLEMWLYASPDLGENVRGGGEIFKEGAAMISPSLQRVEIKNNSYF